MRRPLLLVAVFGLALLTTAPGRAQGLDFAAGAKAGPIEVLADDGLEWNQGSKTVVARGNAQATRGDATVRADTLTAHYRDRDGQSEIWLLEGRGNVVITTPTDRATGDFAAYDLDKAMVHLKGAPARLVTPTDTVTASERLEYWEGKRMAVAIGEAEATRDDRRIRADHLTGYFKPDSKGSLTLDRADAVGNVVLTTPGEVARGDKGDYDAATGIATLTGTVKITRAENQLNGGYAQVNLNTGISRLLPAPPGGGGATSRVQGLFVPERKGEAKPAGTPAGKPATAKTN